MIVDSLQLKPYVKVLVDVLENELGVTDTFKEKIGYPLIFKALSSSKFIQDIPKVTPTHTLTRHSLL